MAQGSDFPPRRSGAGPVVVTAGPGLRPPRQRAFERIRAFGVRSRAQLARELDLSPATITASTAELLAMGLVAEAPLPREDDHEAGRGRPATGLALVAGALHVAGLNLSDKSLTAVLADMTGDVLAFASQKRSPETLTPDALIARAASLLDEVCAKAGLTRDRLSGAGIGIPGVIDTAHGSILWSPLLKGGASEDFAARAGAALGLPVRIDNDANLVTLSELWFGAGRSTPNFAVVTVEQGLGMGLVIDQSVWRGGRGLGLELAHTKVQMDGALCRCGQRGCLEAYVADYALVREAMTALDLPDTERPEPEALPGWLHDLAGQGHPGARSITQRAGRHLAAGLANVINLFDPALIILAGPHVARGSLFAAEVMEALSAQANSLGRALPPVQQRGWDAMLWAEGAVALMLDSLTADKLG